MIQNKQTKKRQEEAGRRSFSRRASSERRRPTLVGYRSPRRQPSRVAIQIRVPSPVDFS
jgi:hypothetical protein